MSNGDRQLLPVLSNASDSELAPLVEYITKAFSSGIESKARYKPIARHTVSMPI